MNHIYRLCWNRSLRQWVVASELATRRSGSGACRVAKGVRRAVALVFAAGMPWLVIGPAYGAGGPSGGQIVSGIGSISQAGAVTTIQQGSQTLQLNWQSFNVGAGQTVNFVQPGASALAVNRIFGSTPSAIMGHLNANGQVWLINPNGVLFGPSARVNVGGIVASTLDLDPNSLSSSTRRFSGNGQGSVVNQGTITAADGGYVALLGNRVSNQGVISARLGTIALAGGSAATLTFDGSRLVHIQVDASTLDNLAENRQLLVADGGQVIMTAGAKDALLASAVNNTGKIRAQTVEDHQGTIVLLGGMEAGQVNVGGTLDASAPNGGNGGFIETSAAQFNLAPDTHITAAAPLGRAGTWLVDPTDLTIDANAASTISNTLNGGTSVTEQTTATGATGAGVQSPGAGDINVNAAISWTNAAATLTLDAYNAINVNAGVNGAGGVTMLARGANLTIGAGGSITGGTGVTLATAGNFVNNAGSAAVSTGTSSPWLIYSSDPKKDTTGGLTPSYIQYNAPYGTTPAASGNGFLYSLAPTITLTGLTGSVTKVYDGTTTANLTNANLVTTGLYNGDIIASATGSYATSNAGTGITVNSPTTFAGVVVTTATGIPAYGYQATGRASADIGTITPAPLTAAIVNNPTTVYDGTTSATLTASNYSFTGFVQGQGATVNQASSVAYASPNAGTNIPISATFTSTNFVANSGTNLANYTLPTSATGTGTITPAPLSITGLIANNKVYDGTRAATLNTSGAAIFGVISTDSGQVSLDTSGASGLFATPNVGNGISVAATGFTLTGAKAGNYTISPPLYLAANITPKSLTITGITASDKVYDATTAATLNLSNATITGLVPSDASNVTLSTSGATGTFSQSNVGNNLALSVNGVTLGGSAASNYSVTAIASGLTANITPAPLTITLVGSPTKVYDGTNHVVLGQSNYTITGFVGGQSATIDQVSGSYATSHAGTNIPINASLTPSDFVPAAGTAMSNYTFSPTISASSGIITPAPVTVTIINNPTKTYDGNDTASLGANNYQVAGAIPGESITLNPYPPTGTYASSNVGYWNVSATIPAGDYQAGPNTLLTDYALPTLATGMGTIVKRQIGPGELTASITDNPTKTYDGTTTATIPADGFTFSGFVSGQGATVNQTITGQYASKDAGSQPVTASLTQSELTPNAGTDLNNYSFPVAAYGMGTILPAPLTVYVSGLPRKVYNGDTIAPVTGSNLTVAGFVSGEGATVTPTSQFNYASANAGTWIVSGSLVPGNYTANSGTLLSNYLLPLTASGPGIITPAPLYIINAYATNKVYDTTTADTLNVSSASLSGLVPSDAGNVTLNTSTTGTFAQSNVGNGIAVTASGFGISGSAAGNYTLQPITGLAANITPAPLTVTGAVANNKVYDATTTATINTGNATLSGVLGSDSVTLSSGGATGQFITANVGNNLLVTASGFTVSGPQAGNYTVSQPSGLFANITPAPITVTITGNPIKQYDGTTSVTLGASDFTLSGFVGNQSATITQTAASGYLSPNVGTNVGLGATLEPSDYSAAVGTNLSNYSLPTEATGTLGEITAKIINLQGTRVYDATTGADSSLFLTSNGTIAGVNGETLGLTGAGVLSTKNVGNQQPFVAGASGLNTLTLVNGSGLASNYTLVGGVDWVTITPAQLTVLNTAAANKVYDGNTNAALSGATLYGVLGSDQVALGNTTLGQFNNKNVGNGKPVSTSMTISGTDSGNYTLIQPTGITANITPLGITVTATGIDKYYDGTTNAQVNLTNSPLIAGDNLTFSYSASFSQANVGQDLPVTVTGITATGANAGNYTLNNTTANTTANILARIINLQGTRVYDATTNADSSVFAPGGTINTGVNSETLTLTGTGTLNDKNVGTQKPFASFGSLALGNGTGQASNYTLVGGTDWLTITPYTLTVSGTYADNKTYDGTTTATIHNSVLNGVFSGDQVALTNTVYGTFATKNVGNDIPVSTNFGLSGTDSGNYIVQQPSGITADISALHIAVATATGQNKVYDATTTATVGLSSAQVAPGDQVTFSDTSALFVTPNVGTGITINVSGITMSGADSTNYVLDNSTATTSANITPYVLSLTGSRVYNATTSADANLFSGGTLAGVNNETVTLSGSGVLGDKNVGTQKPFTLGTLTLGNGSNGGLASNYTLAGGTDWLTVTAAPLTVNGTTANNKVYDGNTNAVLNNSTLSGVFSGDQVALTNTATGTFASPNVNNGIAVSTNFGLSGTDADNYTLTQPTGVTANITPYVLSLQGTRVYDGTTNAAPTLFGNNGVLTGTNGETLTLSGAGALSSPNVGTQVPFGANGTTDYILTGNGTALASNYTLAGGTDWVSITPYVLNLTGSRVYNATTSADASNFGGGTLTGVNGETVTLSGSGVLNDKNVGSQKPFALGTLALGNGSNGGLASNYTLAGTDWLTVTPAPLSVTGTTAANKVYDGTTNAALQNAALSGVLGSDAVTLTNTATGTFASPNVNNGIAVATNFGLSGTDAGNYTLTQPTGITANITPYTLVLQGTRVYDGTTGANATLFGAGGVLTGVNGETLTLSGSGTLASKNVNSAQPFATLGGLSGYTLAGNGSALASNYTLGTGIGDFVSITPKALTITAVGQNKVYDATTNATLSSFTVNGLVAGDDAAVNYNSANFATANVGQNILITVLLYATGADIGNYTFGSKVAVTSADITPRPLTITASAQNKTYDGTTTATLNGLSVSGLVGGDTATFTAGSANFATANAGNNIQVNVTGITGTGSDLGNYTFATTATTTADIFKYLLSLQGTRVYDGTTGADAALFGNNGVLTGVNGETLTLSGTGTLSTKNVGTQNPFAANGLSGYTLTGNGSALANNYTLGLGSGDWVTITPKALTITATGNNKVYDGTTVATLGSFSVSGLVQGDNAQVGYDSANFTTANVGTSIPIVVGLTGSGTDLSNYSFGHSVVLTSADITPKLLTITATAQNKTYDATTTATLNGLTVSGLVGSDTATFTAGSANFATANAGRGIPVNVAGITGTGSDLGNYTYSNTATTSADILPYVLNLTGTRVYDGTNLADASLFGNNGQLTGVAGQTLTLSGNGTLTTRNVGREQPFIAGGGTNHTLTGNGTTLASNYTLIGGVDWVTITPLAVTVTATGVNKVYDGTSAATVGLASNGILSGDNISFSEQSASFATPNAGNGIAVSVAGITASGAGASNYTFNTTASTFADITPVVLNLTGSRVYDATTGAAAGLFGANGVLQGVNGETLTLSGSGTLATKNVGNQNAFAAGGLGGYTLTGNGAALAGNYTLAGGVDWVTVTPAPLTVVGTLTTNRAYDGTVLDALTGARLSGVLGNDTVTLGNADVGYFNNPAVGIDKPVTTAMTTGGADVGNYVLVQPTGLTADIIAPVPPVPAGTLASVQAPLAPDDPTTPYGTASDTAQGSYAGNQKQEEHPNERNVSHADFHPGLALTVLNGGVRLPAN
ncbi:YDG domain-containing protein [Paraburkholderia oxyphila]|uniref:YDG domain-containing protein n=1 Tax=Paraburkholderia oxyphila TaxID=614212 RepID=UPI000A068FD4|nr:YDG domain-containing protein [Paraburkholderia oxyphila]